MTDRTSLQEPALVAASRTAAQRDQHEFEARLGQHRGIVFKIANSYCPRSEERDDLVQEICMQLWRSYPRYDPERRFSTWMYRVALNTAISFARTTQARERRAVPLEESGAAETAEASRPPESGQRVVELYRFLRRLSELDRALVVLHLEDHSYREIAEVLGITETNVGTKLARLKQRLRRDLAPEEETAHGAR